MNSANKLSHFAALKQRQQEVSSQYLRDDSLVSKLNIG